MTSVIEVKDKCLLGVPDEMQVPTECLPSARQGQAADLRVIFTKPFSGLQQKYTKTISRATNGS